MCYNSSNCYFIILNAVDDGEVFQVKKSSQSRRLIKQLKAEKKAARKNVRGVLPATTSPTALMSQANIPTDDSLGTISNNARNLDKQTTGNIPRKTKKQDVNSWTLSGIEAEALHMEEEESDENSSEDDVKDPLQKMLQSG